jgi:hypothetical protein
MSMIDTMRARNSKNSGDSKQLPRAPTMAAPPAPAPAPYYDEEVLRVAQRDFDNKQMIVRLEAERDEWRRKCLAIEEDNKRLQERLDRDREAHATEIDKLADQRDRKIEELTQQRDEFKLKLTRFETKIVMIADALIKLANHTSEMTTKLLDEIRREQGATDVAGKIGLAAIADAIEEPMPRVVTTGPAQE